jgi:multidrug efflux system membrane fusion protein
MLQARVVGKFLLRALTVLLGLLIAVALLAGAYYGLARWKQSREAVASGSSSPPATPVAASKAVRGPLPTSLEAIGSLKAVRQVAIAPEVGGTIAAIHFESGGKINKGDPIIQLNDAPDKGDLERWEGIAFLAEQEYQRFSRLRSTNSASASDMDAASSKRAEVRGQIARTKAVIAQKKVLAPFSGVLGVRKVNLGEYLQPGQAVVTLTDLDTLYVDFTLPEQALPRLTVGLKLEVAVDAYPGRVFPATLTTVEPQVYAESRTVQVQGTLDNRDQPLRPGMFASVRVVLPPEPDVVTVPETALDRAIAGDSVFVVRTKDGGHVADRVSVKAGRRVGGRVVILDGVKGGDLIVTSGQINLAPGSPVAVTEEKLTGDPDAKIGGSQP